MTKETFQIDVLPDGTEFVYQAVDEMDKNHGPQDTTRTNDGRMYADPCKKTLISFKNSNLVQKKLKTYHSKLASFLFKTALSLDGVTAFRLYKSKLNPDSNHLWQKSRRGLLHYTDEIWYEKNRVGHDPLERFMPFLSDKAMLSKRYTNHSVRATCISTLDEAGVEARHIMKLSSHKNESTIKEYATECPENKRKEMFVHLSNAIKPPKRPKSAATGVNPNNSTGEVKTEVMEKDSDNPTFDLGNVELQPLNSDLNFDTIDENLLLKIMNDIEDKENNEKPNKQTNKHKRTNKTNKRKH